MGWSFCSAYGANEKKRYIQENLGSWENEKTKVVIVKQSSVSNIVWSVMEVSVKGEETYRIISCNLLSYRKSDGWGHKSLDESVHPFYYSCPVSFFKLAPVPYNQNAKDWREKVLAENEEKKRKKQEKENLPILFAEAKKQKKRVIAYLTGCKIPSVEITSITPFLGYSKPNIYKMKMKIIERIEVV